MSRKPSLLTEEEKRKRQNKYNKKYIKVHSSEDQKYKRALYNHDYHRKMRELALEHYGKKCTCCGESIYEFLEIDHINNDGAKHRKEMNHGKNKGGNIYKWLHTQNYPDGFQTLCSNCNNAKGRWGECPHKRKL
jgi:5-methylcytosine-specific restriction endonuclease McrA